MLQNLTNILQRSSQRYYASAALAVKPNNRTPTPKKNSNQEKLTKESTPYISCKRPSFNLLVPAREATKFRELPLASSGWMHYKSKNDHFTINATQTEEELRAEMVDVTQFLQDSGITFYPELVENLQQELGIKQFTGIQINGIPKIYDSHHVLIAAETGCGKTLTYLLPIVHHTLERKRRETNERKLNTPLAVIITPGRELATQIGGIAVRLGTGTDLKVKTILGGNTKRLMMNPDFEEVDILVATIGALSKLVTTGIYRMQHVRHVVLDEADTLLDDSFTDKLCHFLKKFPFHQNHAQTNDKVGTQLVLASATLPTNTEEILQRIIDVETLHEIASPQLHKILPHVEQKFLRMTKDSRPATLLGLVKADQAKNRPVIIFSNKSVTSDYVNIFLNNNGVDCLNLNGDMLMKIREGRFEQFQQGACNVLSTTDIGSRGLDTQRARHVINFDFPLHISDYIHRCGRIGRVGNLRKCYVTNFISSRREIDVVQRIEHAARIGGLLPNVNANIKGIINKRIMGEMKEANIPMQEDAF